MIRRLVTTVTLASVIVGLGAALVPSFAHADPYVVCVGGDNQRRPGYYQGVCVNDPLGSGQG